MNAPVSPVPSALTEAALPVLERHAEALPELFAAILTTLDGFAVASVLNTGNHNPARLSAMSSTVMSVMRALSREMRFKTCKRLTLETDVGIMVFQPVDNRAIVLLCISTEQDVTLGRALWHAERVAAELAALPPLALLNPVP